MLNINKMVSSARSCLGWPYESPGSNDQNGIDCSGLFVKMYRDQGASIYHGSNTIFHKYCSETGKLTNANQLVVGMAVFKMKAWTNTDTNNKWCWVPPGNLSHIGFVISVKPLQIIHASSVAGCVTIDTSIGKWAYFGWLSDVDYSGQSPEPEPTPTPTKTMYIYSGNGKSVNMRKKPDLHADLVDRVPDGESVTWNKEDGAGWAYITWHGKSGWMMDCYLEDSPAEPEPTPDPDFEPDPDYGEQLTVWADNGKPVKLRQRPSTGCNVYDEIPCGTTAYLVRYGDNWCKIDCGTRKGWYMMTKFLSRG